MTLSSLLLPLLPDLSKGNTVLYSTSHNMPRRCQDPQDPQHNRWQSPWRSRDQGLRSLGLWGRHEPGSMPRSIALVARVAVMNSPLTVIDPAAPRRRNPIAIGANGGELWCGRGVDHDERMRSGVVNVFVALGEAGRGYRYASHPRNGDRNNSERRMGHDITRPKATCKMVPRNF
jgi:hypothetical protein